MALKILLIPRYKFKGMPDMRCRKFVHMQRASRCENKINVPHNGDMTRHNFFQYSRNDNVILIPLAPCDAVWLFSPSPDVHGKRSCMHCHCWTRAKWPPGSLIGSRPCLSSVQGLGREGQARDILCVRQAEPPGCLRRCVLLKQANSTMRL